jgi:hypothetical protein
MTSRRAFVASSLGFVLLPAAFAHRTEEVISTVVLNARTATLEVTHRIHGHDLELVLSHRGFSGELTSREGNDAMSALLESGFRLWDAAEQPVALRFIGVEGDADDVLIYQDAEMVAPPSGMSVLSSIGMDRFPQQRNLVNFRINGRRASARFSQGSGPQRVQVGVISSVEGGRP